MPSARPITHDVLPFIAALGALVVAVAAIDAGLHLLDAAWIGRHLAVPGVLLIMASFAYSLRKRKLIKRGKPAELLRLHERLAWAGSLLLLVHAGIHFHAWLPWLAVLAMLLNIVSGVVGQYLLQRARGRMKRTLDQLRQDGVSADDAAAQLHWESLTVDAMKQWRVVHYPITIAFSVLAVAHIVAALMFWSWR